MVKASTSCQAGEYPPSVGEDDQTEIKQSSDEDGVWSERYVTCQYLSHFSLSEEMEHKDKAQTEIKQTTGKLLGRRMYEVLLHEGEKGVKGEGEGEGVGNNLRAVN